MYEPGTTFDTPYERGCVVLTVPDASGNFAAVAPDGVECEYNVVMIEVSR